MIRPKRLIIQITRAQMEALHAAAQRLAAAETGEERVRWQAIERRAARALAFEQSVKTDRGERREEHGGDLLGEKTG